MKAHSATDIFGMSMNATLILVLLYIGAETFGDREINSFAYSDSRCAVRQCVSTDSEL